MDGELKLADLVEPGITKLEHQLHRMRRLWSDYHASEWTDVYVLEPWSSIWQEAKSATTDVLAVYSVEIRMTTRVAAPPVLEFSTHRPGEQPHFV